MKFINLICHMYCVALLSTTAVDLGPARFRPEHKGVDPELQSYANEWKSLAKMQNITFKNEISIGFHKLPRPTVGECYYAIGFREIDIDKDYWNESSELSKMVLLYHEISHCACGREHDFGANKPYPNGYDKPKPGEKVEGFFKDGCPTSIMFPSVLPDDCTLAHYGEYVEEMTDRCDPY